MSADEKRIARLERDRQTRLDEIARARMCSMSKDGAHSYVDVPRDQALLFGNPWKWKEQKCSACGKKRNVRR